MTQQTKVKFNNTWTRFMGKIMHFSGHTLGHTSASPVAQMRQPCGVFSHAKVSQKQALKTVFMGFGAI